MTGVRLLVDNDVVVKLAQMDCYQDTLSAIGRRDGEVGSLGFMLRYMGKASAEARLALVKDKAAADRLGAILPRITEIEPTEEQQRRAARILKQAMLAELDLDQGEVGLMAVGVDLEHADIATGDKRALRSMPAISKLETSVAALKLRLICFEQMIRELCRAFGIRRVRAAVNTFPGADAVIRAVYDEYGAKGDAVFVQFMDHLVAEQVEAPAPGWLKRI